MKAISNHYTFLLLSCLLLLWSMPGRAQEDTATEEEAVAKTTSNKPVKNTFESVWLLDNQSVMVPASGTFEMDIQHRFGTVNNGYDDFFGLYAPSNIRMGFSYAPMERLNVGFGFSKINLTWDVSGKYALLRQMKAAGSPLSVTYYVNAAADTRSKDKFVNSSDRFTFFHQLIVARKLSDKISLQLAPSLSHFNAVEGYVNSEGEIAGKMKNDHFALSAAGRFKISDGTSLLLNYDQPVTEHKINNPQPNISFGLEVNTSSHAFQIFAGNYYNIIPQLNHRLNQNDYRESQFLIGFNITRLWGF